MPLETDGIPTSEEMLTRERGERDGTISSEEVTELYEWRASGITPSHRNPLLLKVEERVKVNDPYKMPEHKARALANYYRKLKHGQEGDYDGSIRYGEPLDGNALLDRVRAELDMDSYRQRFPSKDDKLAKAPLEEQMSAGKSALKKRTDAERVARQVSQAASIPDAGFMVGGPLSGEGEAPAPPVTLDELFAKKEQAGHTDAELVETDEADMTFPEKLRVVQAGLDEAFRDSYVPMRQYLENKLEGNELAATIAREVAETGKITNEAFIILPPEMQATVEAYARHVRGFDAQPGILGTLSQSTRSMIGKFWSSGVSAAELVVDKGIIGSGAGLYSFIDPVASTSFMDDVNALRASERAKQRIEAPKYPGRNLPGRAVTGLAETLPFMVEVAMGPLGAFTAGASVMQETRNQLIDTGDVSELQADSIGFIAGVTAVYVEKLFGIAGKGKLAAGLSKKLLAKKSSEYLLANALNWAGRFAEGSTRTFIGESAEEYLEGMINKFAEDAIIKGDVNFEAIHREALAQMSEGKEVIGLMSLIGGGVGTLSDKSADVTDTHNSLAALREVSSTAINDNPELANAAAEEIDTMLIDTWKNNSEVEAKQIYNDMGISDASFELMKPHLEAASKAIDSTPEVKKTFNDAQAPDMQKASDFAAAYGYSVESSPDVTDTNGRLVEALYTKDGRIIVSEITEDGVLKNVKHEVGHALLADGRITQEEFTFFKEQQDAILKDTNVSENYADLGAVAKLEEAFVTKFAEYTPEQRNLVQRIFDWIKSVSPFAAESGFTTANDVISSIVAREASVERQSEVTQDVYDSATSVKSRNVKSKKRRVRKKHENAGETAEKASRFEGADKELLAKRVAMGRELRGRKLSESELDKMFPDAGLDAKAIINDASSELQTMQNVEGAVVDNTLLTDAVYNKANQRSRTNAVREAVSAEKIEASQKAKVAKEKRKVREDIKRTEKAVAKKLPNEYKKRISESVSIAKAIKDLDHEALGIAVQDLVTSHMKDLGLDSVAAEDAMYKATLHSALYQHSVAKMSFNRTRNGMNILISDLNLESTTRDGAKSIAQKSLDRVGKMKARATNKALRKDFDALLDSKANKRVGSNILIKDRTITPQKAAELALVKVAAHREASGVEADQDAINEALTYRQDNNDLLESDKHKNTVMALSKRYKAILDDEFATMSDLQKLEILSATLADYGSVLSKGNNAIAEASISLEQQINGAADFMTEIAIKQAKLFELNKRRAKLGTKSAVRGKKSFFKGGSWFGSVRARIAEDMTRVASPEGKKAMSDMVDALGFQQASRVYDSLRTLYANRWQAAISDSYNHNKGLLGKAQLAKKIMQLNQPSADYKKHSPDGNTNMSKGQLMQLIMTWRQNAYKGNMKNTGYGQERIDAITAELDNNDLVFIDSVIEIYAEWGADLDKESLKHFGTAASNMSDNYAAVSIGAIKAYTGAEARISPLMPPHLNKRTRHNEKVNWETSVFEMLDTRVNENAHWISHVESSILSREVFGDKEVATNMRENYGDDATNKLFEHLNDVYSNSKTSIFTSKFIKKLNSALSLRYLSGSLKQPFTQSISGIAMGFHYGMIGLAKIHIDAMRSDQKLEAFKALWNSDQFKSRTKLGQTEYIESAMRTQFGESWLDAIHTPERASFILKGLATAIKSGYKFGMLTNTLGDVIPILTTGSAVYIHELKKSEGDAQMALDRTWNWIEETQQSHAVKDQSTLSRRGGVAALLVGQFVNTPGQYAAFEARAFKQVIDNINLYGWKEGIKKGDTLKLLNTLAINHVFLGGLFWAVGTAFNSLMDGEDLYDDEDIAGISIAMLSGPGSANMVASALSEEFLEVLFTGKKSFGGDIIPLSRYTRDAQALAILTRHMLEMDFDAALEDALEVTKGLTAPGRQISEFIENN